MLALCEMCVARLAPAPRPPPAFPLPPPRAPTHVCVHVHVGARAQRPSPDLTPASRPSARSLSSLIRDCCLSGGGRPSYPGYGFIDTRPRIFGRNQPAWIRLRRDALVPHKSRSPDAISKPSYPRYFYIKEHTQHKQPGKSLPRGSLSLTGPCRPGWLRLRLYGRARRANRVDSS